MKRFLEEETEVVRAGLRLIKSRVLSGVAVVLPLVVTVWILFRLLSTFQEYLIKPVAEAVIWVFSTDEKLKQFKTNLLPVWFDDYVAPVLALVIIVGILHFLGLFLHTRLHRAMEWILLRVPLVTTIYKFMRNVVSSVTDQASDVSRFKRVVLVKFPHAGMRVPGFVTSSCRDVQTGKTILCIYVPTTPIPTSGYMLLVPEEEVTELDWGLDETLQAVVSGGISVPDWVAYSPPSLPTPASPPTA